MDRTVVAKQEEKHLFHVRYLSKMKGKGRSPLQANVKDSISGLIGGFLTICVLVLLTNMTSAQWLMAPFGASCVLAFGVWNAIIPTTEYYRWSFCFNIRWFSYLSCVG